MDNIIEYRGVELRRAEHVALRGVDLTVRPGEFIYLIGRVGSGKTSLLKSMYAEVPIAAGTARVLDFDLTDIRRADIPYLRRRIGIVFQDFQLLADRTAYDNLDFVLRATGWTDRDARRQRIDEVLRQVGMQNKAFKMPHQLSGGEQQRVVCARAYLNRPGLILADEPTGNLDPETGECIIAHLHELARTTDTAVIVATHNLGFTAAYPGRVIRCEKKSLVDSEPSCP